MSTAEALDMETPDPNETDAKPAKSMRMHHLDFLRAILISGAIYLHVNQVFGVSWPPKEIRLDTVMFEEFPEGSQYYNLLHQGDPGWRNDHSGRIIMVARQFTIPLLFWISGYALCLSKEKATKSLIKVAAITVIGMLTNAVVFFLGPQDDACNWYASRNELKDYCSEKGWVINFGIGTGSGALFSILFQFWFTLFVILFLVQLHPLCEGLRELQKRSEGVEWAGPKGVAPWFLGYLGISVAVYVGLILLWTASPEYDRRWPAFWVALGELPFLGALVCAVACPADYSKTARFLQYFAALMAVCQFYLPALKVTNDFDGALVTYFHIFKHYFSLGFVMALKRKQIAPICSNYFPLVLIALIVTPAPTNYYLAGVPTYPYFPYVVDRVNWGAGCMFQMFCHDRLGNWAAENGSLIPLPRGVGMGALLAYVFHVPLMVLFAGLGDYGPWTVCLAILFCFWLIAFVMEGGKKK